MSLRRRFNDTPGGSTTELSISAEPRLGPLRISPDHCLRQRSPMLRRRASRNLDHVLDHVVEVGGDLADVVQSRELAERCAEDVGVPRECLEPPAFVNAPVVVGLVT
jgi:hypothetical protein